MTESMAAFNRAKFPTLAAKTKTRCPEGAQVGHPMIDCLTTKSQYQDQGNFLEERRMYV